MGDHPTATGERDLLEQARQGKTSAFDELITLHRNRIYMHAYHMVRNEEDALDLTQETFLRAWKSLARFDGKASLSSWLHRIATNAAIDLCRRRQNRPQVELESGPMKIDAASRTTPSRPDAPGVSHDRQEIRRRIEAAFAQLSPDHRAVIVLKELEDFSYEEIAREVGCSLGTVMSRLFHARKKLQTLLSDLHDEF
jgi:RNA polymerase sigma-70 factor (ECF subfamily)